MKHDESLEVLLRSYQGKSVKVEYTLPVNRISTLNISIVSGVTIREIQHLDWTTKALLLEEAVEDTPIAITAATSISYGAPFGLISNKNLFGIVAGIVRKARRHGTPPILGEKDRMLSYSLEIIVPAKRDFAQVSIDIQYLHEVQW